MSVKLLVDNIIRQTMVLVAQVSTAAGLRSPLSHVAAQVFLDLVKELERQGLTQRVAADMFGLALRSYQLKVQRLTESANERGRSLWESVLEHIQTHGEAGRGEVLVHFSGDGADTVASVLADLTASGLVAKIGKGAAARYRAVSDEERAIALRRDRTGALTALVWTSAFHLRETTVGELATRLCVTPEDVAEAVDELVAAGRMQREVVVGPDHTKSEVLMCDESIIPLGEPFGWEAAVVEHHKAMTSALVNKLSTGKTRGASGDQIGGSTWVNHVWPGHPHYEEVVEMLQTVREMATPLRAKVTEYNSTHTCVESEGIRVVFYAGQNVVPDNDGKEGGAS